MKIIHLPTIHRPPLHAKAPMIIRNQSLFDDFVRLANLYKMAFPDFQDEVTINSYDSAAGAAKTLFCMVEDEHFPLEHMWDWDDDIDNYEGTIRRWLTYIPAKAVGHGELLNPMQQTPPKALLTRLNQVGNNSSVAKKHKQVLKGEYPGWEWGDVLDTFQLIGVIDILDEMIIPPPLDKLPALIRYMNHETGTYFLDYTYEHQMYHIQWSQSSFDWLKNDWQVARLIMDQSDELCHWLIKNPSQLEKVWTILKAAHYRRGV